MPGLPLGAAQQHSVPANAQNYDHVSGIEFIETHPDKPYPRSAAYRKTQDGAQMRVRSNSPELADADLTEEQARAYIDALVAAGVFTWNRVYRPSQGTFVVEGINWRLEVEFEKQGALKRARPFRAEGENLFPDNYDQVVQLLMRLPEGAAEAELQE